MVSKPTISPSLKFDAARSAAAATSPHPCAGGPKGLARVTSSRRENNLFAGSAFPLTTSPCARLNRSISWSTSSTADIRIAPFPRYPATILRYSPKCVEGDSANFVLTVFSEVRQGFITDSSLPVKVGATVNRLGAQTLLLGGRRCRYEAKNDFLAYHDGGGFTYGCRGSPRPAGPRYAPSFGRGGCPKRHSWAIHSGAQTRRRGSHKRGARARSEVRR